MREVEAVVDLALHVVGIVGGGGFFTVVALCAHAGGKNIGVARILVDNQIRNHNAGAGFLRDGNERRLNKIAETNRLSVKRDRNRNIRDGAHRNIIHAVDSRVQCGVDRFVDSLVDICLCVRFRVGLRNADLVFAVFVFLLNLIPVLVTVIAFIQTLERLIKLFDGSGAVGGEFVLGTLRPLGVDDDVLSRNDGLRPGFCAGLVGEPACEGVALARRLRQLAVGITEDDSHLILGEHAAAGVEPHVDVDRQFL